MFSRTIIPAVFAIALGAATPAARAAITPIGQVYPAPWIIQPNEDLFVGDTLLGILQINDGDTLSAQRLRLGINPGVQGTIELRDPGSALNLNYGVLAGIDGSAVINVLDGASFVTSSSTLGQNATGSGMVTVDGAQSIWTQNGDLDIGSYGAGSLTITNGGRVESREVTLAERFDTIMFTEPTASGFARVSGAGSVWDLSRSITVGVNGPARLEVLNSGALVGSTGMTIGQSEYAPSAALFVGTGTTVETGYLAIASGNTSTLDIGGGASLTTTNVQAGIINNGLAMITLDGIGTTWQANGDVEFGKRAAAELAVTGGATLNTNDAWLGAEAGGSGDVQLSGPGTSWTITSRPKGVKPNSEANGDLYVGGKGVGMLTVSNQANVSVESAAYFGIDFGPTTGHSGGRGTLHLENASLSAPLLLVSADDLTGTGQIQTQGWIVDGTWTMSSVADLPTQQQVTDSNGLDIDVQINWAVSDGVFGAGYLGAGAVTLSNAFAYKTAHGLVGYGSQADGLVEVTGAGTSWDAGRLSVGHSGIGELRVSDAAALVYLSAVIGEQAGSQGTLRITGSGTTSNFTTGRTFGELVVGNKGDGSLFVGDGAMLQAAQVTIGAESGSDGTVTVSNGSTWSTGTITVGKLGSGAFSLASGSSSTSVMYLGRSQGSFGSVTISGQGTTWQQANLFASFASIVIEDGADVDLIKAELGNTADTVLPDEYDPYTDPPPPIWPVLTQMTVGGTGTTFDVRDDWSVGYWEQAFVQVIEGADATTSRLYVGRNNEARGVISVDGPDSSLTMTSGLYIGEYGSGDVVVQNGASLQSIGAVLGWREKGDGRLVVSGAGSTVNLTGGLNVRYGETSSVHIKDGAVIQTDGSTILLPQYAPVSNARLIMDNGTLNTKGLLGDSTGMLGSGIINADSILLDGHWAFDATTPLPAQVLLDSEPGQNIIVNLAWADPDSFFGTGSGTDGSVRLHSGADLTSGEGYVGLLPLGNGQVIVEDQLSRWTVTESLNVGYGGTGALHVRNSGVVKTDFLYVGRFAGSSGFVTLNNPGAILDANRLYIGDFGTGQLNITNGALVLAPQLIEVGKDSAASSRIEIVGTHSLLDGGNTVLGQSGSSELLISDGAGAYLSNITMGHNIDSFSKVTVTGSDSFLESGDLLISRRGNAEIYVSDGARVETFGVVRVGGYNIPTLRAIAQVIGPNTRWTTRNFYVGKGDLLIADGAQLKSENAYIGVWTNSTAQATIKGNLSSWQISQDLTVADMNRPAVLTIEHGAFAEVADDLSVLYNGRLVLGVGQGAPTPLQVLGNSDFDGQLDVRVDPDNLPIDQSTLIILDTAGTTTGAFDGLENGGLIGVQYGVAMHALLDAGDGNDIAVVSTHLSPGDLDGSGTVDEQDLFLVLSNWGQTVRPGDWLLGDADNNGVVGISDLELTLSHWPLNAPSPTFIPEPNSLFAIALGWLACIRRRRPVFTCTNRAGTRSRHSQMLAPLLTLLTAMIIAPPASAAVTWTGAVYPYPTETTLGSDDLFIGYNTLGTLQIDAGSVVNDYYGYLGYYPNGTGHATIDGEGSLWKHGRNFHIGERGSATLTIQNGGRAETTYTVIGYQPGAVGEVMVTGAGSTLVSSSNIDIGRHGHGSLKVREGGTVETNLIYIGRDENSNGIVVVEGQGSRINGSIAIYGSITPGPSLTIRNQGVIQGDSAFVGDDNGLSSHLLVDGVGSRLDVNRFEIQSSDSAEAIVEVRNGAQLKTGNAEVGSRGYGRIDIHGMGSRWDSGEFIVGINSGGDILIRDHAAAYGTSGWIGNYIEDHGTVTVQGNDSLWSMSRDLNLGVRDGAVGLVRAINGGKIMVAEDLLMNGVSGIEVTLDPSVQTAPISIGKVAELDGFLRISPAAGVTLLPNVSYPVMSIGQQKTGTFSGLAEGNVADVWSGLALTITYIGGDGNDIWLHAVPVMPGDLDGSGTVDQVDLNLALSHFGQVVETGHWLSGDASNNGVVGIEDIDIILANWSNPSVAPSTVPEPAFACLIPCLIALLSPRHRQSFQA